MFSLPSDKYDVTLTDTHIAIRAKILTDVSALLTWSPQNLSPVLSKEMETNAYHPFAQCSHHQKHGAPVPLTEILQKSAEIDRAACEMLHNCPHHVCAGLDPDNFRSNRKEAHNMDFLDESKKFSYRTIGVRDKMPADVFKKA